MWKHRVIEIILVACALAACVGVAVPMLTRASDNTARLQCLDNLRAIGEAMAEWSARHDRALPPGRGMSGFCNSATGAPSKGNLYAVEPGLNALWDKGRGVITDPAVFRCPGDAGLLPPPAMGEDFTDPAQLSYAMTGSLYPSDPPNKVVVADRSDKSLPDGPKQNTGNHNHRLTNVLFADGSVRSLDSPFLPSGAGSETGSIYIRETGEPNDSYIE
jgi:prepilin-type processing-associated H-X9-DG protein